MLRKHAQKKNFLFNIRMVTKYYKYSTISGKVKIKPRIGDKDIKGYTHATTQVKHNVQR